MGANTRRVDAHQQLERDRSHRATPVDESRGVGGAGGASGGGGGAGGGAGCGTGGGAGGGAGARAKGGAERSLEFAAATTCQILGVTDITEFMGERPAPLSGGRHGWLHPTSPMAGPHRPELESGLDGPARQKDTH